MDNQNLLVEEKPEVSNPVSLEAAPQVVQAPKPKKKWKWIWLIVAGLMLLVLGTILLNLKKSRKPISQAKTPKSRR